MAKTYEVISVFEASDRLFRARFDFGFGSALCVLCDCNSLNVYSNFSKGAISVPAWRVTYCIQLAVTRFTNFLQSGRKTQETSEELFPLEYELQ